MSLTNLPPQVCECWHTVKSDVILRSFRVVEGPGLRACLTLLLMAAVQICPLFVQQLLLAKYRQTRTNNLLLSCVLPINAVIVAGTRGEQCPVGKPGAGEHSSAGDARSRKEMSQVFSHSSVPRNTP